MSQQTLNGWKEISAYIQCGVRTAQRWEAGSGMPVHRPALQDSRAVVSFSDELDVWVSRRFPDPVLQVHNNLNRLVWRTAELASQTRNLQEQLKRSLEAHKNRIASRIQPHPVGPSNRTTAVLLPFRKRLKS
jgi:hypothetical protein